MKNWAPGNGPAPVQRAPQQTLVGDGDILQLQNEVAEMSQALKGQEEHLRKVGPSLATKIRDLELAVERRQREREALEWRLVVQRDHGEHRDRHLELVAGKEELQTLESEHRCRLAECLLKAQRQVARGQPPQLDRAAIHQEWSSWKTEVEELRAIATERDNRWQQLSAEHEGAVRSLEEAVKDLSDREGAWQKLYRHERQLRLTLENARRRLLQAIKNKEPTQDTLGALKALLIERPGDDASLTGDPTEGRGSLADPEDKRRSEQRCATLNTELIESERKEAELESLCEELQQSKRKLTSELRLQAQTLEEARHRQHLSNEAVLQREEQSIAELRNATHEAEEMRKLLDGLSPEDYSALVQENKDLMKQRKEAVSSVQGINEECKELESELESRAQDLQEVRDSEAKTEEQICAALGDFSAAEELDEASKEDAEDLERRYRSCTRQAMELKAELSRKWEAAAEAGDCTTTVPSSGTLSGGSDGDSLAARVYDQTLTANNWRQEAERLARERDEVKKQLLDAEETVRLRGTNVADNSEPNGDLNLRDMNVELEKGNQQLRRQLESFEREVEKMKAGRTQRPRPKA